jgi:hypothetical protein
MYQRRRPKWFREARMTSRLSRNNALAIRRGKKDADLLKAFGQTRGHLSAVASTGELNVEHRQIGIAKLP